MTQDVCHHVWDIEGMICTLDNKEHLKPFCFSLQHGVEHGKRLCPSQEGAGGCGCNWAVVCVLWHSSVIHTSQGMALQRCAGCAPCSCSWYPNAVPALQRQGQSPFLRAAHMGWKHPALHQGLWAFVLWCWFASLQRCDSHRSVMGYNIPSMLMSRALWEWCTCVSVPTVRIIRIH